MRAAMTTVLKKVVRPLRPQALRVPQKFPAPAVDVAGVPLDNDLVLTPVDVLALRQAEEKRQRKLARRTT